MTFPGGGSGENPPDGAGQAPHQGGYEAPPIEQMPSGSFDVAPDDAPPVNPAGAYQNPPGGYPPPPPGYGNYPPPSPDYGNYPPPPGYGPQPYGAAPAKTNPLAFGSLAASVVGLLCGVGSIVGIVLGFIALNQIKQTGQPGHGIAVAGIVVGIASLIFGIIGAFYLYS